MKEFLSSPEFGESIETRYEKSFEKLQSDIESEKVGLHYTNFSNINLILKNGIFSSLDIEKDLKKDGDDYVHTGSMGQVLQETMSANSDVMVCNIIELATKYGSNWNKNQLIENIDELQALTTDKTIGEYKKESPRFKYFIDNVIPKLVEESKKYNSNLPNNYRKYKYYLTKQFFGTGMISTIPPESTKEIFNKKISSMFWGNNIGIFFDSPDEIRTNYFFKPEKEDNGESKIKKDNYKEIGLETGDLGVSSKIKPSKFRGLLLRTGVYNKDSNTFNLNIKLNKHDLYIINRSNDKDINLEYTKTFLKEILKFQQNNLLPIFDKEYNHVPSINSILINIELVVSITEFKNGLEEEVKRDTEKISIKGEELLSKKDSYL